MNPNEVKKCKSCNCKANILCLKCYGYFCNECSSCIHSKEINKDHKIEKIDEFLPINTHCDDHIDHPLNLFCIEDKGK